MIAWNSGRWALAWSVSQREAADLRLSGMMPSSCEEVEWGILPKSWRSLAIGDVRTFAIGWIEVTLNSSELLGYRFFFMATGRICKTVLGSESSTGWPPRLGRLQSRAGYVAVVDSLLSKEANQCGPRRGQAWRFRRPCCSAQQPRGQRQKEQDDANAVLEIISPDQGDCPLGLSWRWGSMAVKHVWFDDHRGPFKAVVESSGKAVRVTFEGWGKERFVASAETQIRINYRPRRQESD